MRVVVRSGVDKSGPIRIGADSCVRRYRIVTEINIGPASDLSKSELESWITWSQCSISTGVLHNPGIGIVCPHVECEQIREHDVFATPIDIEHPAPQRLIVVCVPAILSRISSKMRI